MSRPAIEVEGLNYRYRGHSQAASDGVVHDLSLEVPTGSVYGFLGPNGSGKSTTIRLLMGLLHRRQGHVRVLGIDPLRDPIGVKRAVGYVAEQAEFYPWMRVSELIAFVAHYRKDWDAPYADHLRQEFGLDEKVRISELSKGQRSMLALLLALAFRPRLLILDEPTSALDPRARRRFFEGMLAEYQEDGGTVFVSSHLIQEIAGLVDHVGMMENGQLRISEPVDTLTATVRQYSLTFADEARDPPKVEELSCPGLLRASVRGRQAVVSVRQATADESETRQALAAHQPSHLAVESLSLEEIYLELVGQEK